VGGLDIEEPKIISRVKDRDECIKKFDLKCRNDVERKGVDYEIRTYITDLIGLRAICIYEADIGLVRKLLEKNFEIFGVTDKTAQLVEDVGSFGYKGLHLDARLKQDRAGFPEYHKFEGYQFEIQIRSIVQDAWSEVDHKLKYKRQIPDTLKRTIIRLAALFELADQEFGAVREETARLEEIATEKLPPAQENERKNETLDSFSFLSVVTLKFPSHYFDPQKVDGIVNEIRTMKSDISLREFETILEDNEEVVGYYRDAMTQVGFNFNPFTAIRHMFYLRSATIFDNMLYPRQREAFLDWLWKRARQDRKWMKVSPNRLSRSLRLADPRPARRGSTKPRPLRTSARSRSSTGPSVGRGKFSRRMTAMSRPRDRTTFSADSISAVSVGDRR
jgi:putative GTP pyrophosphokinase